MMKTARHTVIICKAHLCLLLIISWTVGACNICGNGSQIQAPDNLVPIPGGEPLITCQELQEAGDAGQIPQMICETLPMITADACQCMPSQAPTCIALDEQCTDSMECCNGYECQQGFCKKVIIVKGDFKLETEGRIRGDGRRRLKGN